MTKTTVKKLLLVGTSFFMTFFAMNGQKKVLDHSVYDAWKSLSNISISNDAKYSAVSINEQEGNNSLLIRNLQNNKKLEVPRAYNYKITPDQKQIIALIKAPYGAIREARIKKTSDEKMPKDSLAIIDLDKFSITKIPNVKNYGIGKDFANYLAYTIDDTIKIKDKKAPKSHTLVVRNLYSAKEDSLKNVTDYIFSNNGKVLALNTIPVPKDTINKAQVIYFDLDKGNKHIISKGKTLYENLSLSESGQKLAFQATNDSLKAEIKDYALYLYTLESDSATLVVDKSTQGIPQSWTVSDNYVPQFSKNEKRLLLGTAPIVLPKDTTIPDFEKASLDIWHWQEPLIQPQQLVELAKKQKQSYLAYLDLENDNKFYQLGTEEIPDIVISDENNGKYAIGFSTLPYLFDTQWDLHSGTTYDVWAFDLENNTQKKIKTKLQGNYNLSPDGDYLLWYDINDRQYHSYSLVTGEELNLTGNLGINFWNEKYDMPSAPDSYGISAWLENDKGVLVYDAYDIWQLDPSGKQAPINKTKGIGRKNDITFRYIKTDPESRYIKNNENILLSAFDNKSKEGGFYQLDKSDLKELVLDPYTYSSPIKAKDKDIYAFTKENFETSPNLYVTANNWKTERQLSDINPQMEEYNWGTAEIINWTTFEGKETQGIVYKPENFDPNKKYPLLIYFYEKHTDNLYKYFPPAPSRSIINIPFFVSRGYIVFTPDIQYTDGHPGESAYDSVVSGAEYLAQNQWIDKANMAIQGQSWGGYQVAYLVTRTNMFKAAGAGAPVSNMFSAYGGIRWQTGKSRQYQYEQSQSRIGATMWETPELYKENSPIFNVDKVETPLLIMHNDNDGAVPWYQGIELFMALRRLGKPAWLLQYNGEAHNLLERRNTKDLAIRLQQFFDHYLKGDPMPQWMKKGVPATERGRTYGFEFE